ncbi:MAG TPA: O-antigen ligase family protein [Baekduia sp.]|jgi:hypothetical protein
MQQVASERNALGDDVPSAISSAPLRWLRAAPVTVPCLGIIILLGWFAADSGGFPISTWAPGGIVALALLGVALWTVPNDWGAVPRSVLAAVGLLTLYVAWCFASVAWAPDPGAAWEGANRTLMYLAIFALLALWPQRAQTAAVLLGLWVLIIGAIALVEAVRVPLAADPRTLFDDGRLTSPAGYANAAAATFLMAFFPAVALAASRRVAPLLRAAFAAIAVLSFDVALLAISRGSLLALPICGAVFIAFVPGRLRHLVTLVPIGIAAGAAIPALIHLTDVMGEWHGPIGSGAADAAGRATVAGAVGVAVVVGLGALLERRRPPSEATAARLRRVGHVGFAAVGVVALVGALVVMGNPVTRIDHGWDSFKGGYTNSTGNRLAQGLGSNRYDFFRVALNVFRDHPVAGVGTDNFFQQYLRDGRSYETPAFPHSIELRALEQTGIVGALLLFGGFAAALAAVWRVLRAWPPDDLRATVAGGALIAFVYWLVHGSADWLFEYPGLGAAAFAMLGLAMSPAPRTPRVSAVRPRGLPLAVLAPVTVVLAVAAVVLLGLWSADHEIGAAAKTYVKEPDAAYQRLDRARHYDPFSDRADSLAGSIAGRRGDLDRADAAFGRALARVPDDQYATFERGVIASAAGRRAEALTLLTRAAQLAPRDRTTREALGIVRSGGTLDLDAVNRRILSGAQQVAGR